MQSLNTFFKGALAAKTREHLDLGTKYQGAWTYMIRFKHNQKPKIKYSVSIISAWRDHGEKSVSVSGFGSLEEIIKSTVAQFLKQANRSDIQGTISVTAFFPIEYDVFVTVPEEYYLEFVNEGLRENYCKIVGISLSELSLEGKPYLTYKG
jgi:hypothetical protein